MTAAATKKKSSLQLLALLVVPAAVVGGVIALRMSIMVVRIPQNGMFPTYAAGPKVIVSRRGGIAGRGEVALFAWPERPEADFIQRVIARDGDVLELADGHPTINGWAVPSCDVGPSSYEEKGERVSGTLAVEFLEGHAYLVFYSKKQEPKRIVAKRGEMLFLGDNRNNSYDSRDFGSVATTRGRPWSEEKPTAPPNLQGALKDCLDKQPSREKTVPPPAP